MDTSTAFRSAPEPITDGRYDKVDSIKNEVGASHEDIGEPLEGEKSQMAVLDFVGILDMPRNMPAEAQQNLRELTDFVTQKLESAGKTPTLRSIAKEMQNIKEEMGLDDFVDPDVSLERMGGVVKAWKEINFISDPQERRSLFMKLARQPDTKSMNRLVYQEMNKHTIWR